MSLQLGEFKIASNCQWTMLDTFLGILLISFGTAIQKNVSYFYADYANGLGFSHEQYSYFVVSQYIGKVTSIAFSPFNDYFFSNSLQIARFYGIMAAIFAFMLPICSMIDVTTYRLIWCCIIFWLFGNCWALFSSTIFHIASVHALDDRRVISYLMTYWAIATVLYLPISYMIADVSIYLPFLVLAACLLVSILFIYFCRWKNKFDGIVYERNLEYENISRITSVDSSPELSASVSPQSNIVDDNYSALSSLKQIMRSKECRLIFMCIFVIGISFGLWENILASLWLEEVYGWSTTTVGWFSALLCIAELFSMVFMFMVAYKMDLFTLNFSIFSWQSCVAGTVFILCAVMGDSIGGVWVAILVNVDFYFMFQLEYFILLLGIVKYRPSGDAKRTALVALTSFAAFGKCIGVLVTAKLWNYGSGLGWISLISVSCYLICIICWIRIYLPSEHEEYQSVIDAEEFDLNPNTSVKNRE